MSEYTPTISDADFAEFLKAIQSQPRTPPSFPHQDSDELPRLNLRSSAEVRELPRPPYLIDGAMPVGALFQVFGQTGSYKSFVVLDMALCIANGAPWLGQVINDPGPVVLILGEGGGDAGVRIDAWLAAHPGMTDQLLVYSIEEQLDLMSGHDVTTIINDLEAYRTERFPDKTWKLIVFDTQADHMPTGDEDKSKDFTVVKRSIQRIRQETGAAVGLVHHTGWDKSRERGSSRQRQALDVVVQIDNGLITNIKQKGGKVFDPIRFEAVPLAGSLYVRELTPLQATAADIGSDLKSGRFALAKIAEKPDISQNDLKKELGIGHGKWKAVEQLLMSYGYLELQKIGVKNTYVVTAAGHAFLNDEPRAGAPAEAMYS